jgi:hypothetical protein
MQSVKETKSHHYYHVFLKLGNLMWCIFRVDKTDLYLPYNSNIQQYLQVIVDKYKNAMINDINAAKSIFFINLDINLETMKRRRPQRMKELPFVNEEKSV